MKIRLTTYIFLFLALLACTSPVPYRRAVGYVEEGGNDSLLIVRINDEVGKSLFFNLNDKTQVNRENLIEGNIVEVEYLAPTTAVKYDASVVTASPTYRRALGVWQSGSKKGLKISFELLPHGKIRQSAPESILLFKHWQLTPVENEIELIGEVAMPLMDATATDETDNTKDMIADREPMSFRTRVSLDCEEEQEVMLFNNDSLSGTKLLKKI